MYTYTGTFQGTGNLIFSMTWSWMHVPMYYMCRNVFNLRIMILELRFQAEKMYVIWWVFFSFKLLSMMSSLFFVVEMTMCA